MMLCKICWLSLVWLLTNRLLMKVLKRGLKPEDIKPLTLSNFEVFRQELERK